MVADSEAGAAAVLRAAAQSLIQLVPPAELETCTGRIAKLLADLDT